MNHHTLRNTRAMRRQGDTMDLAPTVEKLHSNPRWQQLQEDFFATGDAAPVLAGINTLTEEITLDAYRASLAPILPDGVSILAVGGF